MTDITTASAGEIARVILVNTSPAILAALEKMLAAAPGLQVVGTARHGQQALPLIETLRPNVVCLETEMPHMDGLLLTTSIMGSFPTPILVLEAEGRQGEAASVAQILEAGALDNFLVPRDAAKLEEKRNDFTAKVRRLSRVPVITRSTRQRYQPVTERTATPTGRSSDEDAVPMPGDTAAGRAPEIVAIGSSTGGPQVLLNILSQLPPDYARAILCVQHISKGFLPGMVDWLNSQCAVTVKIARTGEVPRAAHVYFAEEDHHLELDSRGSIWLSRTPPVGGHRPAVTVLFESMARRLGSRATGVLLTGMGTDGALGLKAMALAGALTIAQDEASCVVFGMPRQAIALGAAKLILPTQEIVRKLLTM